MKSIKEFFFGKSCSPNELLLSNDNCVSEIVVTSNGKTVFSLSINFEDRRFEVVQECIEDEAIYKEKIYFEDVVYLLASAAFQESCSDFVLEQHYIPKSIPMAPGIIIGYMKRGVHYQNVKEIRESFYMTPSMRDSGQDVIIHKEGSSHTMTDESDLREFYHEINLVSDFLKKRHARWPSYGLPAFSFLDEPVNGDSLTDKLETLPKNRIVLSLKGRSIHEKAASAINLIQAVESVYLDEANELIECISESIGDPMDDGPEYYGWNTLCEEATKTLLLFEALGIDTDLSSLCSDALGRFTVRAIRDVRDDRFSYDSALSSLIEERVPRMEVFSGLIAASFDYNKVNAFIERELYAVVKLSDAEDQLLRASFMPGCRNEDGSLNEEAMAFKASEIIGEELCIDHIKCLDGEVRETVLEGASVSTVESGILYEKHVEDLYKRLGYSVETTAVTGDYGIDLIVLEGKGRVGIQCKNYSSNVGVEGVMQAHSGSAYYNCDHVAVVAPSGFTTNAILMAEKLGVELRIIPFDPEERKVQ
ncbi:restriction endonuclease [Marinimicrobium koreense]|jgi:hypothetical protein|uniref:restriction endonuclease n=1 Tax=Marinimicrobium koreense TaxID=306545 RepID=UPI003F6E7142